MDPDSDLPVSMLIYVAAILCGLAVVGVPIYWASRPTVLANPGVRAAESMMAAHTGHKRYPVAHLQSPAIVSPAMLAAIDAKAARKTEPVRQARIRRLPPIGTGSDLAQAAPPEREHGFFARFSTLF